MMTISIRRAYPVMIILYFALTLAGCATTATLPPEVPAMHSNSEFADDEQILANDPMEGYNRSMYKFNYNFDKYFFIPVVDAYEFVLPTFAQTGVTNFFNNINEGRTFYNSLLQAKGTKAMITAGRFLTNTTLGIGGLFDPATSLGMKRQTEDFGQTLGHYGVGSGSYVVLPILGPSNVRDTTGIIADSAAFSLIGPAAWVDDTTISMAYAGTAAVDRRHRIRLRYHQTGSPFEYELLRTLYSMKREYDIAN